MYLRTLRLWNFRKYGSGNNELDLTKPDLLVPLKSGLNVLIGENDSGKTAIIDAVKIVLKTHSAEWIALDDEDFFESSTHLRIECEFFGLEDDEAGHFPEWLSWEGEGENARPYLKVFLDARRNEKRILPLDIKAGLDEDGTLLNADAREYLKTTYLRPLRDSKAELIPRRNSRLSQILRGHTAFKKDPANHLLVNEFKNLNKAIEKYFEGKNADDSDLTGDELLGKELKDEIDKYLNTFSGKTSHFEVAPADIKQILERLELDFSNQKNLGLGSYNLLFISTELLHLHMKDWNGLRLGLIEEIESHLHPQIQLQVVESLQSLQSIQLIITTHSPNIGSKVTLDNLLICHGSQVYPMGKEHTLLSEQDYKYLQRFLDVTKSNLFFAKGVILVEGWSEELFLPSLARRLGINLTEKGVSIVNIGNTSFLRYSKIFQRIGGIGFNLPVAVVTDLDVKPAEEDVSKNGLTQSIVKRSEKESKYDGGPVKTFVSPHWTFEYCIALCLQLRQHLFEATKSAGAEMTTDGYSGKTINEDWDAISTGKNTEEIALAIYDEMILRKKISKVIVAQHLADILDNLPDGEVDVPLLRTDASIKYLIDAIEYASGNK